MNLPLQAVLKPTSTKLFDGLHRVVGFVGSDVLLIRLTPPTHAPFETDYDTLLTELRLDRIAVVDEPTIRGMPDKVGNIRGKSKAKFERAQSIIAELQPKRERDQSWLRRERLQVLVALAVKKLRLSPVQVSHTLYRWLAAGRSNLALAPRHCTGPCSRSRQKKGRKRGRKYGHGHLPSTIATYSLALTPDVRSLMHAGIKEFYDPSLRNFTESRDSTLDKYFSRIIKGRRVHNPQVFSPRQYRREIDWLNSKQELRRAAVGEQEFGREHRGLAGKESDNIPGPTFLFQADATFPKVDLVCEYDRSIKLGSATVYLLLDAWDGVIVGDHETYQPETLDVARVAIFYAFSDKYEEWKRHGVPLNPGEFDCHHVCHELVSDRGPLRSAEADQFVRGLGINLTTLLARRPDLKAIVEECNSMIELDALKTVPGYRKNKGSLPADFRPSVTLPEFRTIVKRSILRLNLRPARMIPVGACLPKNGRFTRLDHHAWGIKEIRGAGRTWNKRDLYLRLLPRIPCRYNRQGISLPNGLTFRSKELANSGLTAVGDSDNSKSGELCLDRDDVSRAWFVHPSKRDGIEVQCTDRRVRDARASLEEALSMLKRDGHIRTATTVATQQRRSELAGQNRATSANAERKARAAQRGVSKAQMNRGAMRREDAKAVDRAQQLAARQAHAGIEPPEVVAASTANRAKVYSILDERRRKLAESIGRKI
jgi:putative transposase